MTDTKVEVLKIPEGSVLWLHNAADTPDGERVLIDELMPELKRIVGHTAFAVLVTNGNGIVRALGTDEIIDRLRSAVEANWPEQV